MADILDPAASKGANTQMYKKKLESLTFQVYSSPHSSTKTLLLHRKGSRRIKSSNIFGSKTHKSPEVGDIFGVSKCPLLKPGHILR